MNGSGGTRKGKEPFIRHLLSSFRLLSSLPPSRRSKKIAVASLSRVTPRLTEIFFSRGRSESDRFEFANYVFLFSFFLVFEIVPFSDWYLELLIRHQGRRWCCSSSSWRDKVVKNFFLFILGWERKKFTSESTVGEGRIIFMRGGNTFQQIFILLACNIHELFCEIYIRYSLDICCFSSKLKSHRLL